MGEMYRQLRGRLYKTGYRRTKASPKEVQIGTTGQNAAITAGHGVSAIANRNTCSTSARYNLIKNPT